MIKTRTLIIGALLANSCSSFYSFEEITDFVRTNYINEDLVIDSEYFDSKKYSFMKLSIGSSRSVVMSLESINSGIFKWISEDNVAVYTRNGRIIKTEGLEHNIDIFSESRNDFDLVNNDSTLNKYSLNLYNPDYLSAQIIETIEYVDEIDLLKIADQPRVKTKKYRVYGSLPNIKWDYKNLFYVNSDSGFIEKSHQFIHPKLPIINLEYYLIFKD